MSLPDTELEGEVLPEMAKARSAYQGAANQEDYADRERRGGVDLVTCVGQRSSVKPRNCQHLSDIRVHRMDNSQYLKRIENMTRELFE